MDNTTTIFEIPNQPSFDKKLQQDTTQALEMGRIPYLPHYCFQITPDEKSILFSKNLASSSRKNISYNPNTEKLGGIDKKQGKQEELVLKSSLKKYCSFATTLVNQLFPSYTTSLMIGRTSFRPSEIAGRKYSKRKDDTRLHVDAFPSTPVNGNRILRVFCNVNPNDQPRIWNVGEPFNVVLNKFYSRIPKYNKAKATLLRAVGATKSFRSAYDHHMLHLHDQMKLDDRYQKTVPKQEIAFPASSTWVTYTDLVSHAALSGQYVFEQTFYLPIESMTIPEYSPARQISQKIGS